MNQDSAASFINGFFGAMFSGLGDALAPVVTLILSAYAASPAIASILLVWAQARWPLLQRSRLAAGAAGVVLTFIIGVALVYTVAAVAEDASKNETLYRLLPYFALAIVAVAVWFQYRHRATFTPARGVGIACTVLLPILLLVFAK